MDDSRKSSAPKNFLYMPDFDLDAFLAEHIDDFVVIVSGGCTPQTKTGFYAYRTWHGGKKTALREQALTGIKSSPDARLEAVRHACSRIEFQNQHVYVLSNVPLDLDHLCEYAHTPVQQAIAEICTEKHLELSSITVFKSKDLINEALELKG